MKFYLHCIFTFLCNYQNTSTKIKPELKRNILIFGYGINFKYKGELVHSYVVTKFILPLIGDLDFSTLTYDNTCAYLDNKHICNAESKEHMLDLMTFCKKIEPFVNYYKRLITSYINTAHSILEHADKSDIASDTTETIHVELPPLWFPDSLG